MPSPGREHQVGKSGILLFFIVIAGLLGGTVSQTQATVLQPHALNTFDFSYVENIFGPDGKKKGITDLAPGDQLIGIITVNRIVAEGHTVFASSPTSQLSGIYAHKVLYALPPGVSYAPHLLTTYGHVEFGSPELGSFSDGSTEFDLAKFLAPGEMFSLWLDQGSTATTYTTSVSLAEGVARATDGTPFISFGLGDSGYFYGHTFPSVTADLQIGNAFSGLEVLTNATGLNLAPIPNPDDLERGVATPISITCNLAINPEAFYNASPWALAGTGTAEVYPAPEPSTFALFGAAGVVVALWRPRKRS